MPYCTQSDLLEQITEAELVQLTVDDDSETPDAAVIARAIADADAEIDSYCSRYPLPFDPVPDIIRKISVDIALYNLYSRRQNSVTEERTKRYDNAIRFLRDAARGLVSLGINSPPSTSAGLPGASTRRADRIFTIGRNGEHGTLDTW